MSDSITHFNPEIQDNNLLFSKFHEIIEILTDWIDKFEKLEDRLNDLFPTLESIEGMAFV